MSRQERVGGPRLRRKLLTMCLLTLTPSHAESLYKQHRGQVLLELLAGYACAEYPLALYITDGQRSNRLKVQSRRVVFWTGLTAAQALYLNRQDLVKAPDRKSVV